jgi:hypothetical protein
MKRAAFNQLIADTFSTPVETVVVYTRNLKEAGLLTSTGARGRAAPDMTALDAARTIIALLTCEGPRQAVDRVKRFGAAPYSPHFKRHLPGYETIQPEEFSKLFQGECLEDVLAYIIGLPRTIGVEAAVKWYNDNVFHLRILDFEVLAELYNWVYQDGEIVKERVVPFKGATWTRTDDGWKPVEGFERITGSIQTERSISSLSLLSTGGPLAMDH